VTDPFWPGDHRAGMVMSDAALFDALVSVENAWLAILVECGVAPEAARAELSELVGPGDLGTVAAGAERDGNPVPGLVALLRERADDATARWVHRGLTSQDVVDSALMLCLRDALNAITELLTNQVRTLTDLTERHRGTPMLTRTLTQPALPGTAGLKFAGWLSGVLDAADGVAALPAPAVQVGGAAGTMAAATELGGSPEAAARLVGTLAERLGLVTAPPWHTRRSVLTRAGDALVSCCDAWGRIANDVATGSRAEIGEFTEGFLGGSSTMPHKNNPVLSVLLRRTALTAPPLGATLHAASAAQVDERADGGWHAEWATVRTLARRTVVAASQAADLLAGLRVDTVKAAANLAVAQGIYAEQQTMSGLTGHQPAPTYLGATEHLIDTALLRARHYLEEPR
jgi:3-carboxy-cis,cis-muconate cycloisomerase